MTRTGKVLLARDIKIDKGYKNVLDYSESQIVTLLNNNLVASFTNCSFLRMENAIDVDLAYGTALQANYIGFQNPDYSNKWFSALLLMLNTRVIKLKEFILKLMSLPRGIHIGIRKRVLWFVNILMMIL